MEILRQAYDFMKSKGDPRVDGWFLMNSPVPTCAVVALYLIIVTQGPKWMKDRPAFNLKPVIIFYNSFLVVLSSYMVFEVVLSSWLAPDFNLACQKVEYSPSNSNSSRLLNACWWFFFSKIIELMDTIFFVLRKKNNQISFLHIYHHTTMPLLWWVGVKFVGGGEAFFSSSINSGIHVLMYLYYMLSAMGPAMQPYLWWKKYMTTLQLIQFWMVLFKTAYAVYLDCGYPVEYGYILVTYMVSHIILFSNFYYQTYSKQARKKKIDSDVTTAPNREEKNNNGYSNVHSRRIKRKD